MEELKRIIDDSEITKEDDALWPPPDRVGRQVSVLATSHSAEILELGQGDCSACDIESPCGAHARILL